MTEVLAAKGTIGAALSPIDLCTRQTSEQRRSTWGRNPRCDFHSLGLGRPTQLLEYPTVSGAMVSQAGDRLRDLAVPKLYQLACGLAA
jgi:hypothetical protein